MRKKLLAGLIAVPMTLAALVGFAGCDFIDAITGGDDDDSGSTSGGGKGSQVTESQWEEVFGNSENYNNYTSDITGVVTTEMEGTKQKYNVTSKFQVDGAKNYSLLEEKGMEDAYLEIYGYKTTAKNYTWVRLSKTAAWEQQEVSGLPLNNLMMADYADCYGHFKYNSSTNRYEATRSGLSALREVALKAVTGDMDDDFETIELRECSFTIKNGVPVSASMTVFMSIDMSSVSYTVLQDVDYTFSNYGKTTVTYPAQIENELKGLGLDPGKDPGKDPVTPENPGKDPENPGTDPVKPGEDPVKPDDVTGNMTGNQTNEANWEKIFTEFNIRKNFSAKMYADMSLTGSGTMNTTLINQNIYYDGNKSYNVGTTFAETVMPGYPTQTKNLYSESYGWMNGDKYHTWSRGDKNEKWEYVEFDQAEIEGEDAIFGEDYSQFYQYVKYNTKTGAYEMTPQGLEILNKSLGVALSQAYAGTGIGANGEITKYQFFVKNNTLNSMYMEFEMVMGSGMYSFDVTEKIAIVFSDIGKTNVTYPSQVESDIKLIQSGGKPSGGNDTPVGPDNPTNPDNPDTPVGPNEPDKPTKPSVTTDTVSSIVWKKAFDCIEDNNYTVKLGIGDGSTATVQKDGNKTHVITYEDGKKKGSLWQYLDNQKLYAWTSYDEKTWERSNSANLDVVLVFLDGNYASLYSTSNRELSSDSSCYEITESGLKKLSEAINKSGKLPSSSYSVTVTSCSIVIKNEKVYSIVLDVQTHSGGNTSYGTAEYYFSDIGSTNVQVPSQIDEELKDLGIRA